MKQLFAKTVAAHQLTTLLVSLVPMTFNVEQVATLSYQLATVCFGGSAWSRDTRVVGSGAGPSSLYQQLHGKVVK